jgi:hypothetical protein
MDRNQDLGSNAEISLSCGTDIFDVGRQTEVSDSDDDLPILYLVQKRKGIADLAATKYDQGGHTNEFFDNVFQNFEAFEQKDSDNVFQNFEAVEQKDSDIKDHIFYDERKLIRAKHELDVRKSIIAHNNKRVLLLKDMHKSELKAIKVKYKEKVKTIREKHKLKVGAIRERHQNRVRLLYDSLQKN